MVEINQRVSYLPATENPISSDVVMVKILDSTVFFDVGCNKVSAELINGISGRKIAVLSHFHPDHIANLLRCRFDSVYCGANTAKYLKFQKSPVVVVKEKFSLFDGLKILPVPSSHAKGSLAMCVDGICFLGDAAYPGYKLGKKYHNANFLRSLVDFLKRIDSEEVFYSHEKNPVKTKEVILGVLESIQANWREEKGLLFKK